MFSFFKKKPQRPYEPAIEWIRNHSKRGVMVSDRNREEYPEVTGYLIPTLLEWGEHDLARQFAQWLCEIQNEDGSWNDSSGEFPYTFDTGQVLKGLAAIEPRYPEVTDHIQKGVYYIEDMCTPSGRLRTANEICWSGIMPDSILLYATNKKDVWNYHLKHLQKPKLSHFAMYIAEAMVDTKIPLSDDFWPIGRNGMVPGVIGKRWCCIPGQFQFALVKFKQGNPSLGEKAYQYGLQYQDKNGGFKGCTRGGWYFPDEQPSWAVKFFLDATLWRMKSQFTAHAMAGILREDGRLIALKEAMPNPCSSALDAGCGLGRYLGHIQADEKIGMDISPWFVEKMPCRIEGSLLDIPFPDNHFDCTYAIESLEHSIKPTIAISEMCRVTKPGGTVIIIDKNLKHLGRIPIAPWEQWFDVDWVCKLLEKFCSSVTWKHIGWENNQADGLFVLWSGVKR